MQNVLVGQDDWSQATAALSRVSAGRDQVFPFQLTILSSMSKVTQRVADRQVTGPNGGSPSPSTCFHRLHASGAAGTAGLAWTVPVTARAPLAASPDPAVTRQAAINANIARRRIRLPIASPAREEAGNWPTQTTSLSLRPDTGG